LSIPQKQIALQLTAPDELTLNESKDVHSPGPYQILCKVEAVGLCFSDLKLVKQFENHVRKSQVVSGISPQVLKECPNYVPDKQPTVPGHETVVTVSAIGEKVTGVTVGKRYLVQTDYRWLPTLESKSSFGYNFEGGLQQYVLMDQRVITSPDGELFMLDAPEGLSASAVALVEPWACVENAYVVKERCNIKEGGQMLVVADAAVEKKLFYAFLARFGKPAKITFVSDTHLGEELDIAFEKVTSVDLLDDAAFDDVVYFGSNAAAVEKLSPKIATAGLLNIVQCDGKFSRNVVSQIGRVHYGCIRIIGTQTNDPSDSMAYIPATGEIRPGDKLNIIGAGGPMGVMHVFRTLCLPIVDVSVFACDIDQTRIDLLEKIAAPTAAEKGVDFQIYDVGSDADSKYNYVSIMAALPELVEMSVTKGRDNCIINIFAGIPAQVSCPIDLNAYIQKHMYLIGTSGSELIDMKNVLRKLGSSLLDTNISVAAVCGLAGAIDGIRAVENRSIPGKIVVYPQCKDLPLTNIQNLAAKYPQIATEIPNGIWTKQAEDQLLEVFRPAGIGPSGPDS
jgi:D-arabinose 1-dehydrogenase-like Zn-dependent alcohol dehydrogenase